jgi:hypothetical protein
MKGLSMALAQRENGRFIRALKHHTGLDRAIAFSILGRGWSALSGIVSVSLIARFLSASQQGYYYTFYGLVGLQIIFELGFSFVILQLAAHERANLVLHEDGTVEGEFKSKARLASVLQKAVRWYSYGSVLLGATLLVVGFRFFTKDHGVAAVSWKLPWIALVISTTLIFQIDPIISFLEGCGKVVDVGRLRMTQGVLGSILAWSALAMHHGLYSPALTIFGQALSGLYFLFSNRKLLIPLLRLKTDIHSVSWNKEIWPFQWRIAVSWASAYFIWQVLNPIVFAYRGPVEAGRLGMSLSIATSIGNVALAWVTTKASPFGALIARRRYVELDTIFFRALKQSFAMLLVAAVGFVTALPLLFHIFPHFRERVLPIPLFIMVLLTTVLSHVVVCQAYYLRAHKKEPFLFFFVAIAIISVFSLTGAAKYSGVSAVVIVYFFCSGVFRSIAATYVFLRKRREWHAIEPQTAVPESHLAAFES